MTKSADLHPARLPGYGDEPFTHQPEPLNERLFWLAHLHNWADSTDAEELLYGADYNAAAAFQRRLFEQADWPTFTIPLPTGHRLHIVYRTFEEDEGIDYLLHHPDWDRVELLATEEGHFMGPGLSWPELVAAAGNALPGGTTTDPHARLLLLLPALGDDALPDDAKDRLAAALRARAGVEAADTLATALLEAQGLWGPARWTTTERGIRINDGEYSVRNPQTSLYRPTAWQASLLHWLPNRFAATSRTTCPRSCIPNTKRTRCSSRTWRTREDTSGTGTSELAFRMRRRPSVHRRKRTSRFRP